MKKRSLKILSLAFALLAAVSCKKDNNFKNGMAYSDLLSEYAKQITYNIDQDTKLAGVFTLRLTGNQAFNAYYWGWEVPDFFMESSNQSISTVITLSDPLPTTSVSYSYFPVYSDGTVPYNTATTGTVFPKEITARSTSTVSTAGVESADDDTYVVTYSSTTGLIADATDTRYDSNGDLSTLRVYTFEVDPRDSSRYYTSHYQLFGSDGTTLTGATAQTVTLTETDDLKTEVVTLANYDTDSALADYTDQSFGTANSSTILKTVETTETYYTATSSVAKNTVLVTTEKYSSASQVAWKQIEKTIYADAYFGKISSYSIVQYNVSTSDTETLTSQNSSTYSGGLVLQTNNYTVSGGSASLSTTYTYAYDDYGRLLTMTTANSSSKTTKISTYTRDATTGNVTSYRPVTVSTSTGTESCASGNYDMTYETVTVSSVEYKKITQIVYGCSSGSVSSTATSKSINFYNARMQLVSNLEYTYTNGGYVLSSQVDYTYASATGAMTKQQDYTVSSGVATASTYTVYAYDSNNFLISTIVYTAADAVSASYTLTSYTYN
ncbi:MAG: hypothetical protein QNL04_01835 [SAR324 cluster bacterium]|nr:hypothetical protein [SAR324 cluster bacterium]